MKYNTKSLAFTIVELLIVVVVIAILAAITIVSYNGITSQAKDSALKSSLSQAKTKLELYKVRHGAYPATGNLSEVELPDSSNITYSYVSVDGTAYCLTATDTALTYGVTSTTSPAEGGCSDTSWLGKVELTNMVVNGDLSQGTTGWSMPGGRGTYIGIVEGGYSASGTGTPNGSIQVSYTATPNSIVDRVYYRRVEFRVSSDIAPSFVNYYAGTSLYTFSPALKLNQWQVASGVTTQSSTGSPGARYVNASFSTVEEATTATLTVKNVVLIDLTESFGAGNEPTKEQMDIIIQKFPNNYFDGTISASS